jgi:superoxide reductase
MKTFQCKVCGHIEFLTPSGTCPVCGAPVTAFEEKQGLLKKAGDGAVGGETEKKHVPRIVVVKTCGLIPQGCEDVHVKIGEIEHPMTKEHQILWVTLYVDDKYVAHTAFSFEGTHPAAAYHLKTAAGKVSAVERCNLHGFWYAETIL